MPERRIAWLGLSDPLVETLRELEQGEPTPVQQAAIPAVLERRDVRASAETGSGKTAAFVLPMLELLSAAPTRSPRPTLAIVLAPTRELAAQIAETISRYGRRLRARPKTVLAIGGVSINPQMMELRGGAEIVVATPGRLLDLVEKNALRLGSVEMLVLDEADQLLSLGFAEEFERVLALLPRRRQNLLFSATFPPGVSALAERLLHDPVRIDVDAHAAPADTIHQRAIEVDVEKRTQLLCHLLTTFSRALVFVATKHRTEHVARKLHRARIDARALHGDLSQGARAQALADFKAKKARVLVATDVAARGLDILELPVVVNYDLPRSTVDYLHRIGRTGRAGVPGTAVSFVTAENDAHFRLIEKRYRRDIERERIPGFEPTAVAAPHDSRGGVRGKRKSKKDRLREAAARGTREK